MAHQTKPEASATGETELERIEKERVAHVGRALLNALLSEYPGLSLNPDSIDKAAKAAILATDRFPQSPESWPFNTDLNTPPAGMHRTVSAAFDVIDAGVFNGDTFHGTRANLFLSAHAQRWSQAMRLRREDDCHNRPGPDEGDEGLSPDGV